MFNTILNFILRFYSKDLRSILKVFDKVYHELEEFIALQQAEIDARTKLAATLLTEAADISKEIDRANTAKKNVAKLIS
jgi:hypothetical protein